MCCFSMSRAWKRIASKSAVTTLKIVFATDLNVFFLHVPSMEEDCVKIGQGAQQLSEQKRFLLGKHLYCFNVFSRVLYLNGLIDRCLTKQPLFMNCLIRQILKSAHAKSKINFFYTRSANPKSVIIFFTSDNSNSFLICRRLYKHLFFVFKKHISLQILQLF